MPNTRYRLRSELPNTAEAQSLLSKIAENLSEGPASRIVIEMGLDRFHGNELTNVSISGSGTTNNIQFTRPNKPAKGSLGGLNFTAVTPGPGGNAITVAYTTGGTAGSEVVSVVGSAISVQIAAGVSTQTQVKAALDGSAPAAALISTAVTSGGTAVAAPAGPAAFTGGSGGNGSTERYDIADIENIRRLRTKKHLIVIKADANPA